MHPKPERTGWVIACSPREEDLAEVFDKWLGAYPIYRLSSTDFAVDLPIRVVIERFTLALECAPEGGPDWTKFDEFLGVL